MVQHKLMDLIYILTFFFLSLVNPGNKVQDIDMLPNLWIVTMDRSGSMYGYIDGTKSKKRVYHNIPEILDNIDYSGINFRNDKFIFYETGLIRKDSQTKEEPHVLLGECNFADFDFTDNFIHPLNTKEPIQTFGNKEQFKKFVLKTGYSFTSSNRIQLYYHYYYSFVSLLRPLTIHKVITTNDRNFFKEYNRVFIITLTDDGEIDDQWQIDAKTISQNLGKLKPKLIETINSLVYNPFNQSHSSDGGSIDIFYEYKCKDGIPRVYMSEYITRMNNESDLIEHKNKYLKIEDGNENDKLVTLPGSLWVPYHIVEIKQLVINSKKLDINQKVTKGEHVLLDGKYLNNYKKNRIQIFAEVQFEYNDAILGKRIKKEDVTFDYDNIYSQQYVRNQKWLIRNREKIYGYTIALIILSLIVFLIIYWLRGNAVILTIIDNIGNRFELKRFAFKKLKNGEFNIISYTGGATTVILNKYFDKITHTQKPALEEPKCLYFLSDTELYIDTSSAPIRYDLAKLDCETEDVIVGGLIRKGFCYKIDFSQDIQFSLKDRSKHLLTINKYEPKSQSNAFYKAIINETRYRLDGVERFYLIKNKIGDILNIGIVKTNHKYCLNNLLLIYEYKVKSDSVSDIQRILSDIGKSAKKENIKLEKTVMDITPDEKSGLQLMLEIRQFTKYISLTSCLREKTISHKIKNLIKGKYNSLEHKNHFIELYSPFKNVHNKNFHIQNGIIYSPTLSPFQKRFATEYAYYLSWHPDLFFIDRLGSGVLEKVKLLTEKVEILTFDHNYTIGIVGKDSLIINGKQHNFKTITNRSIE